MGLDTQEIVIRRKRIPDLLDEKPFLNIKTKEVAYLLGIIWADGYLQDSRISMEIVAEDFQDIEPLVRITGNWKIFNRQRPQRKLIAGISSSNRKLLKFLFDHFYSEKSYHSPKPIIDRIPKELQRYWWRGYSDGDGCFYWGEKHKTAQYVISSAWDQDWSAVENQMKSLNIEYNIKQLVHNNSGGKISRSSRIRLTGHTNVCRWANFLYQDWDGTGFQRKYDKWQEIYKWYSRPNKTCSGIKVYTLV